MLATLAALVIALGASALLVRAAHTSQPLLLDHGAASGPQKFHAELTPRVGGLAIALGLVSALTLLAFQDPSLETARWGFMLVGAGAPVLAVGLAEDLTKKVRPRWRLLAAFVSAFAAVGVAGLVMVAPGLWGVAWLLSFPAVAMLLTAAVVASLSHAVNLIDGFNGLAAGCVLLMLGALCAVAHALGDGVVGPLALLTMAAVGGFFFLNFPSGRIFLGDGGAYFLGFWYAQLALLLLARNPGAVSPLFPVLVCIYPAFETIFSVWRRRSRGRALSQADGQHLHSLIYRRYLRGTGHAQDARTHTLRNSMTSPFLWLLCLGSVLPAVLFHRHTGVMLLFIVLFVASYVALYRRIVRFRGAPWVRAVVRKAAPDQTRPQ